MKSMEVSGRTLTTGLIVSHIQDDRRSQIREEEYEDSSMTEEEEPYDFELLTLKTPLSKVIREKIGKSSFANFETIQGALDFNSYMIRHILLEKEAGKLDRQQLILLLQNLELNLKQLATFADQSLNPDLQRTVHGQQKTLVPIKNDIRANKFVFSEQANIKDSYFSLDY